MKKNVYIRPAMMVVAVNYNASILTGSPYGTDVSGASAQGNSPDRNLSRGTDFDDWDEE